jgi:hypothetical protein
LRREILPRESSVYTQKHVRTRTSKTPTRRARSENERHKENTGEKTKSVTERKGIGERKMEVGERTEG